jgi:hypothetical protein
MLEEEEELSRFLAERSANEEDEEDAEDLEPIKMDEDGDFTIPAGRVD